MAAAVDVLIIGGGIAGVSAGCLLAERGLSVHLVETEATLAHHTTGRSAAIYLQNYGPDVIRRLTIAGRRYLDQPPYADGPLWGPMPFMSVTNADRAASMFARAEQLKELVPSTEFIDADTAIELCPVLRRDVVVGAILEPDSKQLDVAGFHQMFVRGMKIHGATISTSSRVIGLSRSGSGWRVQTPAAEYRADVVVNAAGAWCDQIALLGGVSPIGLRPLRRTVCVAALPPGVSNAGWPFVDYDTGDPDSAGYFRPEGDGLLISPADETPSEPCDAKPEEVDVALGIQRAMEWTTLDITRVRATWAGLRSFVADRVPVCGFAPDAQGFFWLAGQGGFGIHSSAGLAEATVGLIVDGHLPAHISDLGVTQSDLAPNRPTLRP